MKPTTLTTGLLALAATTTAATLRQVTNFGSNPSGARMYIYVPDRLAPNPALITAIHYCTGTANAFYTGTPYARLADQHGFIVVYPESPNDGGCWDVSSRQTMTRNGGANSNSIANMVTHAISTYNVDPNRVFVTGTSSGAMMTNIMVSVYPDLFKAASAYAGVPAGCFYTGTVAGWNSTCAQGRSIATPQAWAQTVFNMYPGYTGDRPKMLIYHGSADDTIFPNNFNETMKQWAGVHGYTYGSPAQTVANSPAPPYTRIVYGEKLVGVYGAGVTHNIPVNGALDLEWFGITGGSSPSPSPSQSPSSTPVPSPPSSSAIIPTPPSSSTAPAPTPTGCTAPRWAQCGGQGYTGCTSCVAPYTCQVSNNGYSQCL